MSHVEDIFGSQADVEHGLELFVRGLNEQQKLSLFGKIHLKGVLLDMARTRYAPLNCCDEWNFAAR